MELKLVSGGGLADEILVADHIEDLNSLLLNNPIVEDYVWVDVRFNGRLIGSILPGDSYSFIWVNRPASGYPDYLQSFFDVNDFWPIIYETDRGPIEPYLSIL